MSTINVQAAEERTKQMTNQPKDNKPQSAIEQLRHLVFDIQPDDHDEAKYQLTVIRTLIEACWQLDARNKELSDKLELESRAKGKLFEYIAEHKKRLDALESKQQPSSPPKKEEE